jgi:hypothetical protein
LSRYSNGFVSLFHWINFNAFTSVRFKRSKNHLIPNLISTIIHFSRKVANLF